MNERVKKYYQGNDVKNGAEVREFVTELMKDAITYEAIVNVKAWEIEALNSLFAEVPVQSYDEFTRNITREKTMRYLELGIVDVEHWGGTEFFLGKLKNYYSWLDTRGSNKNKGS